MMTEWEASEQRISCRAFTDRRPDDETLDRLQACVDGLNRASGLHFQLIVTDEPQLKLAASMFSGGVCVYAALVGRDDCEAAEKVGYYGQQLVLYATQLGLGTCWVAGTYDKASAKADVSDGEKLWDVIPIGYAPDKMPVKQKMIRAAIRAKSRKKEDFLDGSGAPDWVWKGIDALMKGPSAVNRQPVIIVYRDGEVSARLRKNDGGLAFNDLGIAKRQFEIGAAEAGVKGHFLPGDGAVFVREE